MSTIKRKPQPNGASEPGAGSHQLLRGQNGAADGCSTGLHPTAAVGPTRRPLQVARNHLRQSACRTPTGPVNRRASAPQRGRQSTTCLSSEAAACVQAPLSRGYVACGRPVTVEATDEPVADGRPAEAAEKIKLSIQIMSDLHLGFPGARGFPPLAQGADLVLIAGDTCEGLQLAVRRAREAYPATDVVAVAGNHEFHWTEYDKELDAARISARELGIHLLENDTVTFGRLRIIGATLWTDYSLFGESVRLPAMGVLSKIIRDHRRIGWMRDPWKRFRPQEARRLHLQSRAYIETKLAKPHAGPTLVLTHHGAVVEALKPELRDRLISAADASDLLGTIDRYQPDYWVSGHTHHAMDIRRGRTRLISNPCGYGDECSSFDPAFVIEVDT